MSPPSEHNNFATDMVARTKALAALAGSRVDEAEARSMLREVIDPELGINIVDLGLVYGVDVHGADVHVQLTLTSPACPMGPHIMSAAKAAVEFLDG